MAGRHRAPSAAGRRKDARRAVETSEYAAMMIRVIFGYGRRVGDDPAGLAHLRGIEAALRDAVNMGIFTANKSGGCPYSLAEIGGILGITKQSVHKRRQLGEDVFARVCGGSVVRIADIRAARAAVLASAGVQDRTGSVLELAAGG